MLQTSTPKLDPREQHYWTALPQRGLNLFLRHLAPAERRGRPRIVTVPDQWARFIEDVPASEAPVLDRAHFADWGERYLDCDAEARRRDPPGVKIPTGPFADILAAWHGELAYDPGAVRAPVAIIRGAWDGLVTDDDARWLFDAFTAAPDKRDIKISRGTHLMHLETMRHALYEESIAFLNAKDSLGGRCV
jgi:hypothetical protein